VKFIAEEKICGKQFSKHYGTFTPKTVTSVCSQKYRVGIRDQKSGKKPIPDPGSRG
jgi:hypothetical protein